MPVYVYRGTDRTGNAVSGERTAASKAELMDLLKRQQIKVNKMSEKGKEFNLPTFGGKVKSKEIAVFTRQFSVMIDAGLPLVQCLEILAGQQENKTFKDVLTATRGAVEGGSTLSSGHGPARKGLRSAVREPGGSGRDGRYSRHHSAAPGPVHRKERQAQESRAVGAGLSRRRDLRGGGRHHAAPVEGRADFCHSLRGSGSRPSAAHAHGHRPEQFHRQHLRLADRGVFHRRRHSHQGLVRHAARAGWCSTACC